MSNECKGIIGAVFGHNFKPRFSESAPVVTKHSNRIDAHTVNFYPASKESKYEFDICTRCGEIIYRTT